MFCLSNVNSDFRSILTNESDKKIGLKVMNPKYMILNLWNYPKNKLISSRKYFRNFMAHKLSKHPLLIYQHQMWEVTDPKIKYHLE
jgi:hypothetical protein